MAHRLKRPTWSEAIHQYVLAMKAANRSPGTIRLHRHYLNQLLELAPSPWSVSHQQLVAVLARGSWSSEAKKSARSVYRGFYAWAAASGYVTENPAAGLPSVRVVPGPPRPAPEGIVRLALTTNGERITFMAQLAAFGGLRVCEIARVHEHDLIGDVLTVHGKGGKRRLVPIVEPQLLARLERVRGYAFPNPHTGQPITAGHVCKLLSEALPAGWTAHTFRHRFATAALNGTGDLLAVMKLLGHSRPETTMRYIALDDERVRAAARATRLAG